MNLAHLSGGLVHPDLRPDLSAGYEVLVHQGVEYEPGALGVGSKEDEVAIGEALRDGVVHDVVPNLLKDNVRIGLSSHTCRDRGLPPRETLSKPLQASRSAISSEEREHVPPRASDHTRQIRQLDSLWIGKEDVANAESGEVLDDERASSSSTDDADLLLAQDVLPSVTEDASLAVVGRIGGGARRWRRIEVQLGPTDHSGALQHNSLATRKPDVSSDSIRRKDERPNRDAVGDV
jgi:hypothetical protein